MASVKNGRNSAKSVSSVQAKALARVELAVLLDSKDLVAQVAKAIAGTVGENEPTLCAKYAIEQALAGLGYLPDSWAPVITARDRSAK